MGTIHSWGSLDSLDLIWNPYVLYRKMIFQTTARPPKNRVAGEI